MKIYLREKPLDNVIKNNKNIEIRLYRGIFNKIKINDIITFQSLNKSIIKIIKDIKLYNSFEELYNLENISNITPDINSKDDFINYYKNIYRNYNLKNFKVIALFI